MPLPRSELFAKAALGADGETGLVVGREGSVLMTKDGGKTWDPTEGLDRSSPLDKVSALDFSSGFIAQAKDREYYRLQARPELQKWRVWPIAEVPRKMMNDVDLRESSLFQEISRFVDTPYDSGAKGSEASQEKRLEEKQGHVVRDRNSKGKPPEEKPGQVEGNKGSQEVVVGFLKLDTLTVMRIVTMTILFFLVQVLVRLYQYNLRLSAFWDSRADAVFLKESFAEKKTERFDDLVRVLGPDAYDFKPPPLSMIDRLLPRSKSDPIGR